MSKPMKPWAIRAQADATNVRREKFLGVDHLVVPVVALVEGVVWPSNAEAPELALASEFGKMPAGWNGRPIVLNHPKRGDTLVSANSPDVLADEQFGMMFNTVLEEGKLKSEMWLNLARVDELGGEVKEIVTGLENGEIIEVSTGLFASVDDSAGEFNGKEFKGIWRNVVPDHLAILSKGTKGACSVEMGCGAPRVNKEHEGSCGCNTPTCSCAKGNQMDPQTTPTPTPTPEKSKKGLFANALSGILDKLGLKSQASGLSDQDKRAALVAALEKINPDQFYWVMSVFEDHFIYEQGFEGKLLSRKFKIEADGTIVLGETTDEVRPQTEFVPVNVKQETLMAKKDLIAGLVANKATKLTDADLPWLESLTEEQLTKLVPNEAAPAQTSPAAPAAPENQPAPVANSSAAAAPAGSPAQSAPAAAAADKPKTLSADEYINQAPAGVQEVLREGMRMQQARKDTLVTALKGNENCAFSEDELKGMGLSQLEKLAKLARVPDYSGQAPLTVVTNSGSENSNTADEPPALFSKSA